MLIRLILFSDENLGCLIDFKKTVRAGKYSSIEQGYVVIEMFSGSNEDF